MSEARAVAHLLVLLGNAKACLEELVLECEPEDQEIYEPLRQAVSDVFQVARERAASLNSQGKRS